MSLSKKTLQVDIYRQPVVCSQRLADAITSPTRNPAKSVQGCKKTKKTMNIIRTPSGELGGSLYASFFNFDEVVNFDNRHIIRQCAKFLNAQSEVDTMYKTASRSDGDTYLIQLTFGIIQRVYKIDSIDKVEEGGVLINFKIIQHEPTKNMH